VSDGTTIATLTARLHALPSTADRDHAASILSQLRSALARGLDGVAASELRAYATLADRFGFHADAWNATALLRRQEPLDPHARVIAARAFITLFADVARRRPETITRLIGDDERTPSDLARAGILARWLHDVEKLLNDSRHADAASTLAAVLETSHVWWPVADRNERPATFTAAFVRSARALAEVERELLDRDRATAAQAWATALRWSAEQLEGEELPEVAVVAEGADEASVNDSRTAKPTDAALGAAADRITENGKRIWVIGALAAKWTHLVGVAKTLGIGAKVLQHVGYDEVQQRSVMDLLNVASDVGVLIGPVPHKASGVGHHSSLVTQLQREAGIPVVDLRSNAGSGALKITKASFRAGLLELLTEIALTRHMPPSLGSDIFHTHT